MVDEVNGRHQRIWTTGLAVLCLTYAIVLVRTAWLGDDCYISFRTIENCLSGYGLRWNVDERVQTFTHPLWLFALLGLRSITGELYYTTVMFSMSLSVIAVLFLAFRVVRDRWNAVFAVLTLLLSRAFVDYSTSGLENPLQHLLLVLLFARYMRQDKGAGRFRTLAFISGLMVLNRLDSVLFSLPVLLVEARRLPLRTALRLGILAFTPLLLWELFSIFYYGTLFPNTAHAKVFHTGVSQLALLQQSGLYYTESLLADPVTLTVVLFGLLVPVLFRCWRLLPFSVGVTLYLLYVCKIGGDFMSGRFFAAPLLVSVAVLSQVLDSSRPTIRYIGLGLVTLLGLLSPEPSLFTDSSYDDQIWASDGISNERGVYYQELGLLSPARVDFSANVLTRAFADKPSPARIVSIGERIGTEGYVAGPRFHLVDLWLCDPLLARLPIKDRSDWRIGHFTRRLPQGYLETLSSGVVKIRDSRLRSYYTTLRSVIRDDLFDSGRLSALVTHLFGGADDLRRTYIAERYPPVPG